MPIPSHPIPSHPIQSPFKGDRRRFFPRRAKRAGRRGISVIHHSKNTSNSYYSHNDSNNNDSDKNVSRNNSNTWYTNYMPEERAAMSREAVEEAGIV